MVLKLKQNLHSDPMSRHILPKRPETSYVCFVFLPKVVRNENSRIREEYLLQVYTKVPSYDLIPNIDMHIKSDLDQCV